MKRLYYQITLSIFASVIWFTLSFFFLIGSGKNWNNTAIHILMMLLFSNFMLWWTVFDKETKPIQLMFWFFHVNIMFFPALSQVLNNSFYWYPYNPELYDKSTLFDASGLITIGISSFAIGTWLNSALMKKNNLITQKGWLTSQIRATRSSRILLLVLAMLQAGFILYFGYEYYMGTRLSITTYSRTLSLVEQGFSFNLPRSIGLGSLLFLVVLLRHQWKQKNRFSLEIVLILMLILGTNFIINFPLGLARFWIFGFLTSIIFILIPLRTPFLRAAFIMGYSIAQFTIFPWFSLITRNITGLKDFSLVAIRNYLQHGDFDTFQQMVNITSYLHDSGFEYGRNILSVILFFIPRSLWEKADPLGPAAAEYMGYGFTNLSAPIHAELYADFGLVSLILGMALLGIWTTQLDHTYHKLINAEETGMGLVVIAVIAGFMLIVLRGSLLGIIPGISVLLGTLLILGLSAIQWRKTI